LRVAELKMLHSAEHIRPLESVSLAFEEVNVDYVQQARHGRDHTGKKTAVWRLHS
jgi:type VI protein secretion system component Hcp